MEIYEATEIAKRELLLMTKEQVKQVACLDKLRRRRKQGLVEETVYSVDGQGNQEIDTLYFNLYLDSVTSLDISKSKIRWLIKRVKSIMGCSNCKETHHACLDFHHLNKEEKLFSIASSVSIRTSIEKIINEIDKCILICSNCHRKEHHPF